MKIPSLSSADVRKFRMNYDYIRRNIFLKKWFFEPFLRYSKISCCALTYTTNAFS